MVMIRPFRNPNPSVPGIEGFSMTCDEFKKAFDKFTLEAKVKDVDMDAFEAMQHHSMSCSPCTLIMTNRLTQHLEEKIATSEPTDDVSDELRERIARSVEDELRDTPESLGDGEMFGQVGMGRVVGCPPPEDQPKMVVSIEKKDNGYVLKLYVPLVYPEPEETKPEEADPAHDQKVDTMIDGILAFYKTIADKSVGGEDWKPDENKTKIREGFKLLFGMRGRGMSVGPLPKPRIENMVFPAKEELLAYLANNL